MEQFKIIIQLQKLQSISILYMVEILLQIFKKYSKICFLIIYILILIYQKNFILQKKTRKTTMSRCIKSEVKGKL